MKISVILFVVFFAILEISNANDPPPIPSPDEQRLRCSEAMLDCVLALDSRTDVDEIILLSQLNLLVGLNNIVNIQHSDVINIMAAEKNDAEFQRLKKMADSFGDLSKRINKLISQRNKNTQSE